jgi:serine/threonine-protein kinase
MPCPADWQLVAWSEGRLSVDQASGIVAHVAQCVDCQKRTSLLSRAVTTGSSPTLLADSVSPAQLLHVPPVGAMLGGKYRVERVLGQGGMGVVVEATHVGLMQRVAIKFLRAEAKAITGALDRFVREARAAAGIRSEHVVRVFDTGVFETGEPYIVMELLAGEDLRTTLMRQGPLKPTEAASLGIEACEALAQAHALGIVHRDLKPANLFVTTRSDGTPLLKVLDFGISKVYGDVGAQTTANVALGSPLYMSPEQIQTPRDVDLRADVWAMGVVLYESLASRPPFDGEGMVGLAAAIVTGSPSPLPSTVPAGLAAVVMRCLEKDRDRRIGSAGDLAAALRPFADAERQLVADRIVRSATPRMRSTPPPSSRDAPPISGFEKTVARSGSLGRRSLPRHTEIAVSLGLLLCFAGIGIFVWSLHAKHDRTHAETPPPPTIVAPVATAAESVVASSAPPPPSVETEIAPSIQPKPTTHAMHTTTTKPVAQATAVMPVTAPPTSPPRDQPVDVNGALRDRK